MLPLCQCLKIVKTDLSRSDGQKDLRLLYLMKGIGMGVRMNLGMLTENRSVNSECETEDGNYEDTEVGTGDKNGSHETGKAE